MIAITYYSCRVKPHHMYPTHLRLVRHANSGGTSVKLLLSSTKLRRDLATKSGTSAVDCSLLSLRSKFSNLDKHSHCTLSKTLNSLLENCNAKKSFKNIIHSFLMIKAHSSSPPELLLVEYVHSSQKVRDRPCYCPR